MFRCLTLVLLSSVIALAQNNSATLTGKLENGAGLGFGGATVRLDSDSATVHVEAQTNAGGVFSFSGLPAGAYVLRAPGFPALKAKFDLHAGEERALPTLNLVLGAAGDCFPDTMEPERTEFLSNGGLGGLAGNVQKASSPVVDVPVTLQRIVGSQSSIRVRTDSLGNFSFTNLAPGRYSLGIGQGPLWMRFTVVGGLEAWYPLKLDPAPASSTPPKLFVCE